MQGKRILVAVIGGLAALSFASSAMAIMSVPYGWYLEANAGGTRVSNIDINTDSSNSGFGGNVNLGYKFMPYVAFEGGYTRYANTDVQDNFDNTIATGKFYSYDLALRGIWPISDSGFELFAKVGAQRINADITWNVSPQIAQAAGVADGQHSVTGFYWGLGAQYYWWPELAINVQYQAAEGNNNTGTLGLISGGISFIVD